MKRLLSTVIGIGFIVLGGLWLAMTLFMPMMGFEFWRWGAWRLWPLAVVALGAGIMLIPMLVRGRRGLATLFVLGTPILVTGSLLMVASFFNIWRIWSWLWPLEILGLAIGFVFAAIYARTIWLLIPAIIIGLNGVVFQFCAITGLWEAWAVLWTIEPLSVGLALTLVGVRKHLSGLFLSGLILCSLAGFGVMAMMAIFPWGLGNLIGSAILILIGGALLFWGLFRRRSPVSEAAA
jgi:hypothetical protein